MPKRSSRTFLVLLTGVVIAGIGDGSTAAQPNSKITSTHLPNRRTSNGTTPNSDCEKPPTGILAAPKDSALRRFAGTIAAPVVYKDTMLVVVTKTGAAVVVFTKETEEAVEYRFRYESLDGKTKRSGTGKVSEKDAVGKKSDVFIEADPNPLRWSYADAGKAWVYYDRRSCA